MAKISTYNNDATPSLSDKLIGTDVDDLNSTKNYTIGAILGVPGSSTYVPYTGATGDVNIAGFGFYGAEFVVIGGTSAQFLKADGSIDSNTYLTTGDAATTYLTIANATATYVPYTGATGNVNLGANKLISTGLEVVSNDATMVGIQSRAGVNNFFEIGSNGWVNKGGLFDFVNLIYKIGDVSATQNGTLITVDDGSEQITIKATDYVHLDSSLLVNGSVGTAGQILKSRGGGLSPEWVAPDWQEVTVNISSLQLTTDLATGIDILPSIPGFVYVWQLDLVYNFGGTPYGVPFGATLIIGNKAGYNVNFFGGSSNKLLFADSDGSIFVGGDAVKIQTDNLTNLSAGNGTLTVYAKYRLVSL